MLFALPRLAVFISAVLFNGGVVRTSTHTDHDPGFLQCQECFFRGTPPHSLSELGLEQRCHRHLTGRPFASLYNANCQTTIYTALHIDLNNGWGRGAQSTVRHCFSLPQSRVLELVLTSEEDLSRCRFAKNALL